MPLTPRRLGDDVARRLGGRTIRLRGFSRPQAGAGALLLLALSGGGCGGNGGTDVILPSLSIRASTSGAELDPDGYSVQVDGSAPQPIGPQATITIDRLTEGLHTVTLSGIAANCAVDGENPKTVTVTAGATATLAFAVNCGPAMGAIEVVTQTSGPGTDPDGYSLLLDGIDRGPVGLSGMTRLGAMDAGAYTVGLAGMAGNCQAAGENPRSVTIVAGETVQVTFTVTCSTPEPTAGNLEISVSTSGAERDPDGYQLSVDGGANQPVGINSTVTLANLAAAEHTVQLLGIAANCAVEGDNPIGTLVPAGGTAGVAFSVACAATAGGLTVSVSGLPDGTPASVSLRGPKGYSESLTGTQTLTGLVPGNYTISASNVVSEGITYTPSVSRPAVDVAAGATVAVTVSYTAEAKITLNLRIDGLYITQSTQTYGSAIPLVAGREAYLRVFVVANESNTASPSVRIRLSRPGAAAWTRTISAPGSSTPTEVQEGTLNQSWNLPIPASQIQPGLSIEAEVDQTEAIKESNEDDNRFPASGTKPLAVRTVPAARIRFVSVQQGSSPPGNVSEGNKAQLMELARRMHPLRAIDADVHASVFTASAPLEANGSGWSQVLGDLDALRLAEGTDRTYFGIARLTYGRQEGLVGLAFQGIPTALGWDEPGDAGRVVAHELGHTWNQLHTPCGSPPDRDPRYPHGDGIGVYGFDVEARSLKPPTTPDIMGYCTNAWISDYTYQRVLSFRDGNGAGARLASRPQLSLLIWGRIVNGRPVLEPAFQIVTRASMPAHPGPYSVTAIADDGSLLFTLTFDAETAADDPSGHRHFAFAVPIERSRAARLASLRVAGPGGMAALSRSRAGLRVGVQEAVVARREGEGVTLRWDGAAHPTIIVRDPVTGDVLSFARGGHARIWTGRDELDVDLSDGVQSQRLRLAINRP